MINDVTANFPTVSKSKIKNGEWKTMRGSLMITLGDKRQLYISGAGMQKEKIVIYLKNINVKISGDELASDDVLQDWLEAPSIYEAYKDYFDYIGFAVPYNNGLTDQKIQKGLAYQASSITSENEFKPDFLWAWQKPTSFVDFKAEDGKTYKMPSKLSMGSAAQILSTAKKLGLEMRGHVLVWHSQTPKFFFREGWTDDGKYVSREEMTARQEWYIKYVLEWVKDWEDKNNGGKRIITTWDVVNEAAADNASSTRHTRDNGDWWGVYKDSSYIANAFRFANKYAPKDVLLCYNDYCSELGASLTNPNGKHLDILKIVDEIQADPKARIDVVGLQTHINVDTKIRGGFNSYEEAFKSFLTRNVNLQVTELDIGSGSGKYSSTKTAAKYKELFELMIEYRKTPSKKGVEGITIWGVHDDGTWLDGQPEYKGKKQHPLLFKKTKTGFVAKREHQAVIEIVK